MTDPISTRTARISPSRAAGESPRPNGDGQPPTDSDPSGNSSAADQIAQLKQERDDYREQALRAGPSSPIIRSGPSSRPTPIGSMRSARWPGTCSTRSTISSRAIDAPAGLGRPEGSPPGSTWSRSSCSTSWPSTASSRSRPWAQPFDPNLHEALVQQPDADHPEGTVVAELSKGYRIRDRVLRPSKVAVSVDARRRADRPNRAEQPHSAGETPRPEPD